MTVWSYFWSGGLKWWAINGTSSIFVAFFLKNLFGYSFETSGTIDFCDTLECECKTTRLLKTHHCDNLPGLVLWQQHPRVCALAESSFVLSATVFHFSLRVKWSSDSQSFFLQWHIVEMLQMLCVHVFLWQGLVKYYYRSSIVKEVNFQSRKKAFERGQAIRIYILLPTFHDCRIRGITVLYSTIVRPCDSTKW